MLAGILSYSPTETGENSPIRPAILLGENGLNIAFPPNSPDSPAIPCKSNSSSSPQESDIEKIRHWLIKIGEPEEDHHLVLNKCRNDSLVLEYCLKHTRSEFESGYAVTNEQRADDRVKCSDCFLLDRQGYCKKWRIVSPHNQKYRPTQDLLRRCGSFKLKKQ
ncbi:hypothetical protein SAMN05421755_103535 [Nitrosomonas sp. Nm33]|nr:hypothetical protein SAMN05421755_103535 [Nitrosomonas sp. Nm33]